MSGRIEAAIERAAVGFEVLSCWSTYPDGSCRCPKGKDCDRKPGKHPIAPNGSWGETRDPERIRTMLSAASGPNYGVIPPLGVFALDVDGDVPDRMRALVAK